MISVHFQGKPFNITVIQVYAPTGEGNGNPLQYSCLENPMDCNMPDLPVHRITVILNGLPWKQTEIILSFLRLHPSSAFWILWLTMRATPFLQRDS